MSMKSQNTSTIVAATSGIATVAFIAYQLGKRKIQYIPEKVWKFEQQGGIFGGTNRPTAGARTEKELQRGEHAIQLYSLATPNGVKVTTFLEELHLVYGLEYDAWCCTLSGMQFESGFVKANPNSKIPAMLHYKEKDKEPIRIFESASILLYLCDNFDKYNLYLPPVGDPLRSECLSWLFWVQGSAPYFGGGFGHFFKYAPVKIKYALDRFTMELKRQLDVLDKHLVDRDFICGEKVTIADFCCWPWYGNIPYGEEAEEYIQYKDYTNIAAWSKRMGELKSVQRGKIVNKIWGDEQLKERHSSADFDPK